MKLPRLAVWTCAAILALVFVVVGVSKLATPSALRWSQRLSNWGYPAAARQVIGVIEIVAGAGLLVPRTRRVAAVTVTAVMIGALGTHLVYREFPRMIAPIVLGTLALLVYVSANRTR